MPAQPRKMKLQKSVGSEDGRTHIGRRVWVPETPEPTGVGSGNPGTHRVWVLEIPEPTGVGSGNSGTHRAWVPETPDPHRNPQGVGSGNSGTHSLKNADMLTCRLT